MKERLFIGLVNPTVRFIGKDRLPTKRKDAFGILEPGCIRKAKVTTQYGKLYVPIKFLGKKIIITLEERK